jgi:class 3 adenylate cyclase
MRKPRQETGVPLELLRDALEAMGFPPAAPDDPIREDELETVPLLRLAHITGVGRPRLDGLERVPAMCFLDLAGYTRLTEERGDRAAAELAGALGVLVGRSCASTAGCR